MQREVFFVAAPCALRAAPGRPIIGVGKIPIQAQRQHSQQPQTQHNPMRFLEWLHTWSEASTCSQGKLEVFGVPNRRAVV
jgi:hypothetical protein